MAIGSVSTPEGRRGTESERGDRQDPRAASDVEDRGLSEPAIVRQWLESRETQAGRRVEPRPEGHPGIEREHDVARARAVPAPRRTDHEPAAHAENRKVRLPCLGPVRLVDDPGPELTDGPQAERLQVTERFRDLGRRRLGRRLVTRRDVPADDCRSRRIDPRAEPLVDELERRARPTSRHSPPAEDLADGLDRLEVRLDGELQPGRGWLGRHPSPSLSRMPPEPPTASPDSRGVCLEELALLLRQLLRDLDIDENMEVAARPCSPEMGHALAAQADLRVRLGPGLDLDLLGAFDGRHL